MNWNWMEMFGAPAAVGAFVFAQVLPSDMFWEKLAGYGALGVICAYLLWERFHDRKAERKERKEEREVRDAAVSSMNVQTMAIQRNSQRLKHLSKLLYIVVNNEASPSLRKQLLAAEAEEMESESPGTPGVAPRKQQDTDC